jgi:hypothetical protein
LNEITSNLEQVRIEIKRVQLERQELIRRLKELDADVDSNASIESISFLDDSTSESNIQDRQRLQANLDMQSRNLEQLESIQQNLNNTLRKAKVLPDSSLSFGSIVNVLREVLPEADIPSNAQVDNIEEMEKLIQTIVNSWKTKARLAIDDLTIERHSLQQQNEMLKKQLQVKPSVGQDQIEIKMIKLGEELEKDQKKILDLQTELSQMQAINNAQKKHAEEERIRLLNEVELWKNSSNGQQHNVQNLKSLISKHEDAIRESRETVIGASAQVIVNNDLRSRITELQDALTYRDKTIEQLTTQLAQHGITALFDEVAVTPERNRVKSPASHSIEDSPSSASDSQVKRIINKFEMMSKEALRDALTEVELELNSLRERSHREKQQQQAKIASLEKECKTNLEKYKQAMSSLKELENQSLLVQQIQKDVEEAAKSSQQEIQALMEQTNLQTSTIEELKAKLSKYEEKENEELEFQDMTLTAELQEKQNSILEAENKLNELQQIVANVESEVEQIAVTKSKIDEACSQAKETLISLNQQKEQERKKFAEMQTEVQETRTKMSEISIRIRDLQEDEQILNEKNQTMEKKLTELRKEISQKNQELREVEVLIQDTKESKSPKEEYRQNRAITDPRTTEERNALKNAKKEKEAILNEILAFQEQLNQIQWQRELLNRVSHLKGVYDAKDLYVSSHEEHETLINSYKTQIQNLEKEKKTYTQRDEQYMKTISDLQEKVDKLVEIHQKTPETTQSEDRNLLEEIQLKDQKIQELTAQYGVSRSFIR